MQKIFSRTTLFLSFCAKRSPKWRQNQVFQVLSKVNAWNFVIFCMMLQQHKSWKLGETFQQTWCFGILGANKSQVDPKSGFLRFTGNWSMKWLIFWMKLPQHKVALSNWCLLFKNIFVLGFYLISREVKKLFFLFLNIRCVIY